MYIRQYIYYLELYFELCVKMFNNIRELSFNLLFFREIIFTTIFRKCLYFPSHCCRNNLRIPDLVKSNIVYPRVRVDILFLLNTTHIDDELCEDGICTLTKFDKILTCTSVHDLSIFIHAYTFCAHTAFYDVHLQSSYNQTQNYWTHKNY